MLSRGRVVVFLIEWVDGPGLNSAVKYDATRSLREQKSRSGLS